MDCWINIKEDIRVVQKYPTTYMFLHDNLEEVFGI